MPKKGKGARRAKTREHDDGHDDTPENPHGELSDKMKRLLADVEDDGDNEPQAKPTQKQDTKSDVDREQYNGDGSDQDADEEPSVRTRYRTRKLSYTTLGH